jgi:phosphotransferase system HPr-like phosphotransfer protein
MRQLRAVRILGGGGGIGITAQDETETGDPHRSGQNAGSRNPRAASGFTREQTLAFPEPEPVMRQFAAWLNEHCADRAMFISDNNGCGDKIADLRSILSILALCATLGTALDLEAVGDDEQHAAEAVERVFSSSDSDRDQAGPIQ